MFTAITTGDWAMLAICITGVALAGIGVMKALKAAKSIKSGPLMKTGKMSRYTSWDEGINAQKTGKIKSLSNEGTYATTGKSHMSEDACRRLSLDKKPEIRIDFDPINNPRIRTDVPSLTRGGWDQTLYDTRGARYIEYDPNTFNIVPLM